MLSEIETVRKMASGQGIFISLCFDKFHLWYLWSFLLEMSFQQANEHKNLASLRENRVEKVLQILEL